MIVGVRALSTASADDWLAWRTILGRCDGSAVPALPGPAVQVTIVGWSGSFPGPQSPASCYLIDTGDFRLVLDLGNGALDALQQYTELGDIDTIEIGPLRITTGHVNHPVETFGFRIEHGGQVLAYSADTGPSAELVRLASGADLLLSEASFLDGPDLPADLHLTARQAAEHAARAGVGELVLTHLVPWNDPATSLEQASAVYTGPLRLASSGLRLLGGRPA